MYHTGKSKYISLGAILGGGFAPKWLLLPLFTELPRARRSRVLEQRSSGSLVWPKGLTAKYLTVVSLRERRVES